jgi:hypothetical protein
MDSRDHETDRLFPILDPPPGGLTRLRARIREDRRRRRRSWALATAGIAVLAFAILVLVPLHTETRLPPWFESDLLAIQLGIVDPPSEPVSIRPDLRHEFAVQRIPTTDERVVFYLVGSRSRSTAAPPEEAAAVSE